MGYLIIVKFLHKKEKRKKEKKEGREGGRKEMGLLSM